jgi:Hemerythrin HHE cation binding domain
MTTTTTGHAIRQVRLAGQAVVPDGPVDLTEMLVAHRAFRRDLDLFVSAVRDTPLDDRGTWHALGRRWDLFCRILHHHHTAEDQGVWPALRSRAEEHGDRAAIEVLDTMDSEHGQIDPLLASVTAGFAKLAATPDGQARTQLAARTVSARQQLDDHLTHEERDALALVQRYLTPADWASIVKNHVARPDSLRAAVEMISWALHELPEPVIARSLPGASPIRLLWRLFLRAPFARSERRLLRHAVPAPMQLR